MISLLKEIYPVQENDGFITEIDGISQERRRGFIGCLMSMEKSVRKLLINLKFKMVMKSNSTKKSIIKILDSNSESFFYKVRK